MKYYDEVISLGQHCRTATALKLCNVRSYSHVFDWSAGIVQEKCGKGGLEGKVDLICNDFKNLFNLEDLENRGLTNNFDLQHLWIVNKRTGLQYTHDFSANKTFEESYADTKEKLERRIRRFHNVMQTSKKILFVYIGWDTGFDENYLILQQEKLSKKFPNIQIDFLYIMHDDKCSTTDYRMVEANQNVTIFYCNVQYPYNINPCLKTSDGNTNLYYKLIKEFCYTPQTVNCILEDLYNTKTELDNIKKELNNIKSSLQAPRYKQAVFSIRNEDSHKVLTIFGIKCKFRR